MSQITRPPHRTFGCLSLEALEARDLPAGYWWSPVVSEYSTDRVNWLKGPGTPYARYAAYENLPGPSDDLHFSGGVSNADCVIPPYGGSPPAPLPPPPPYSPPSPPSPPVSPPPPAHPGDVFNSIKLEGGYSGSVVLARDLQVNILQVGSGYLAQKYDYDLTASGNTHAGDLTVSGDFLWTGGSMNAGPRAPTYNSLIVPGTFNLAATATGLAQPTDGGTVELGYSVVMQGDEASQTGSTLSMTGGTFEMHNATSILAEGYSTLNLIAISYDTADPVPSLKIDGVDNTEANVKVAPKAKAVVTSTRGSGDPDNVGTAIVTGKKGGTFENSGATEITNRTTLQINSSPADENGDYTQKAAANQGQVVPATTLETGSAVSCGTVASSFIVETGKLNITNRTPGGSATVDGIAVITARDVALWAGAVIDMLGTRYNTLRIEGKFGYMGEIRMQISTTQDKADLIQVTGKITVTKTTAKLTLNWGNPNTTLTLYQRNWLLIESVNDIISDDLDKTRVDVSALDSRIKPESVVRTNQNTKIYCAPYITPFV